MYIHEAAKLAHERGTGIFRGEGPFSHITIIPTNTFACCLTTSYKKGNRAGLRWEPCLDDLLATDWEVSGMMPSRYKLGEELQDPDDAILESVLQQDDSGIR